MACTSTHPEAILRPPPLTARLSCPVPCAGLSAEKGEADAFEHVEQWRGQLDKASAQSRVKRVMERLTASARLRKAQVFASARPAMERRDAGPHRPSLPPYPPAHSLSVPAEKWTPWPWEQKAGGWPTCSPSHQRPPLPRNKKMAEGPVSAPEIFFWRLVWGALFFIFPPRLYSQNAQDFMGN